MRTPPGGFPDAEFIQHLRHAPVTLQPRTPLGGELQILAHRHVREQRVVLKHVTAVAPLRSQIQARNTIEQNVVIQDNAALVGFDKAGERTIFQRLLTASGFGPKLALALLSTLGPERTVRSIQSRDIAALSTVSGIGRKKAEKLVIELGDRFKDTPHDLPLAGARPGDEAVQALVRLGYVAAQAEEAVRGAIAGGLTDTAKVIRDALTRLATKR